MLLYVHTPKAIKAGHPADRLFVVTNTQQTRRQRPWITAWKCIITADGVVHPAFKKFLHPDELATLGTVKHTRNGSVPSALFQEDSFYIQISVESVAATIASLRLAKINSPRLPDKGPTLNVQGSFLEKSHDCTSSTQDWINIFARVEVPANKVISQERKDAVQALFQKFLSDLKTI